MMPDANTNTNAQGQADDPEIVVDQLIDQLIEEKYGNNLAEDQRAAEHDKLKEELIIRLNERILAELPEDKLSELDAGMDAGTLASQDVYDMVGAANLNMADLAQDVAREFREDYLAGKLENKEQ